MRFSFSNIIFNQMKEYAFCRSLGARCISLFCLFFNAESGNEKNAAKLLHSLLYTHLHKLDLLSAVEMIDNLVVQENVQTALQSNSLTEMAPVHPSFLTFVTNALKSQVREPFDGFMSVIRMFSFFFFVVFFF